MTKPIMESKPVLNQPHQGIQPNPVFRNRLEGFPVEAGQTWHDLSMESRVRYMNGILMRWTKTMNHQAQSVSGLSGASFNITRG